MLTYDVPPVPRVDEEPPTGPWQEPVILRDMLAQMEAADIRTLLDACSPAVSPLGAWIEERADFVGIEDDEPEPAADVEPEPETTETAETDEEESA